MCDVFLGPPGTPRKAGDWGLWKIFSIHKTQTTLRSLFSLILCSLMLWSTILQLFYNFAFLSWYKAILVYHQCICVFFRDLVDPQVYLDLQELQEERWGISLSFDFYFLTILQFKDSWKHKRMSATHCGWTSSTQRCSWTQIPTNWVGCGSRAKALHVCSLL